MYKSKLQEMCQRHYWSLPEYTWSKEGPDHNPRFSATVAVGGFTFRTTEPSRSSKEAQNDAAKLAFLYFSSMCPLSQPSPLHLRHQPPPVPPRRFLPVPHSSCYPAHNNYINNIAADGSIVQPVEQTDVQTSQMNQVSSSNMDGKTSHEMLHSYKNRLQNYAQKNNLTLPIYSCKTEGPRHACRFKSRVTFDGNTFETSEFYRTLKEAEQATAKLAIESLAESLAVDDILGDEALYKSLLQEFSQRENLHFPAYDTKKSGPSHRPTFLASVNIGGDVFYGQEARAKKQAEMGAAKVAYLSLMERQKHQCLKVSSTSNDMKAVSGMSSLSVQSFASNDLKGESIHINIEGQDGKKDADEKPPRATLTSSGIQQVSVAPEIIFPSASFLTAPEAIGASALSAATPVTPKAVVSSALPSTSSASLSTAPEAVVSSTPLSIEIEVISAPTPTGTSGNEVKRPQVGSPSAGSYTICVFPRKSSLTAPDGAVTLPISDDQWVAMRVDKN